MPQLLHLDGRPQTWDELHARLADYSQRRAERERTCGACTETRHNDCSGWMARVPGSSNSYDRIECPCDCREVA